MPNADIYGRVSTKDQKDHGTSLDSQVKACVALAEEKGYTVDRIFREDFSGATLERPDLEAVRQRARTGQVDAVFMYDPDRMARDPIHQAIIGLEFDKHKVSYFFVTAPPDNTPEGGLVRYIKGYAAQVERGQTRERTMRGRRERTLRGKLPTGGRLFGYHTPTGRDSSGVRQIDDTQASVVRSIFSMVVNENLTLCAIITRLRERGIPSPRGSVVWGPSSVVRLLRHEAYKGVTIVNKHKMVEPLTRLKEFHRVKNSRLSDRDPSEWIELKGVTPPIIDPVVWDQAQVVLQRHSALAFRNAKHPYLLKSRIYCGHCGRKMNGSYWNDAERVYMCPANANPNRTVERCPNKPSKALPLETTVWGQISALLREPDRIMAEVEKRRQADPHNLEDTLVTLTAAVAKLRRQERNVAIHLGDEDFEQDVLVEQLKWLKVRREANEVEELRTRRQLEQRQVTHDQTDRLLDYCVQISARLDAFDFARKQETLAALDVKIYVTRETWWGNGLIPVNIGFRSSRSTETNLTFTLGQRLFQ